MWKYLCLLIVSVWGEGSSLGDADLHWRLGRLREDHPALSAFGDRLHGTGRTHNVSFSTFSEEQLRKWRFLFRFANLQTNMPIKRMLDGAPLPDLNAIANLNFAEFVKLIHSDKSLLLHYSEKYVHYVHRQRHRRTSAMKRASQPRSELTEEDLYEECAIDYDSFVAPITNPLADIILPNCTDIPLYQHCKNDSLPPVEQIPGGRKMVDATFKLPEGIPEGKLYWLGAYEYCNDIEIAYNFSTPEGKVLRQYKGQYTRLDLTLYALIERNLSLPLLLGVCAPNTCNKYHIQRYIAQDNLLLSFLLDEVLNMNLTFVYITRETDSSSDSRLHTMLAIILLCLVLAVASTVYDGFFRKTFMVSELKKVEARLRQDLSGKRSFSTEVSVLEEDSPDPDQYQSRRLSRIVSVTSKTDLIAQNTDGSNIQGTVMDPELPKYNLTWKQCLESAFVGFSLYSNMRRIFSLQDDPDHFRVLDGIKALSYGWFMIGETALLGGIYTEVWTTANIISCLIRWPKLWYFQIVITFILCLDAFYFISGVLMAYWWLRKMDGKEFHFWNVAKIMIHKWWRLWMPLVFTMMLYVTAAPYSSEGPFLPAEIGDATNCYDTWWTVLLMINNFVGKDNPCMTWTTHIPILMQLHFAAMFILTAVILHPKAGYSLLALTYCAHVGAVCGITSNTYDNGGWYDDFFLTPWCRGGPYMIGLAAGIFLYHYKYKGFTVKPNPLIMIGGMGIAIAAIFAVTFATHDIFKEGGEVWGKSTMVAYHLFSHDVMGLGLSWITVACVMGYGGLINSFLALRWWGPLSRCVYQAYLLHSSFIFTWVFCRMQLHYLQLYHLLYTAVGHFWYTLKIGLIFTLLGEMPICFGLERALSCKDLMSWIQHGRHPGALLRKIKTFFSNPSVTAQDGVSNSQVDDYLYDNVQMDVGVVNFDM